MRYLILLFLTGCTYNYKNIQFNDKVVVTSGFFKSCRGVVTDKFKWLTPCQYHFYVRFNTCDGKDVIPDNKYISICDLEKE